MYSLFGDKDKHASFDPSYLQPGEIDYEKDIISITTDSTYNSTSEYAEAPRIENHTDIQNAVDRNISLIQSFGEFFTEVNQNFTSKHSQTELPSTTVKNRKTSSANSQSTTPSSDDIFGSIFGFLFKDDEPLSEYHKSEEITIPPFKKLSTAISFSEFVNKAEIASTEDVNSESQFSHQRINNKIFDPTTESMDRTTIKPEQPTQQHKVENLNILRDVLLDTLNVPLLHDDALHKK